jgi:ferritin
MKENIVKAVNKQIQAEFESAYLYLAMSSYFESENLKGFANWMRVQWDEELQHAFKFYNMLIERDEKVELLDLKKPGNDFGTPMEAFKSTLEHEQFITGKINDLYNLALEEKDYPLQNLLHWFIDEQVEEENNVRDIIDQLKLIGENGTGLYMLDRELAQRQAVSDSQN